MRAQCSCGLVWLVVAGREGRGSQQAAPTAWQSSKQGRGTAACCLLACTTLGGQSHLADLLAFLSSSPCSLLNIPLSLAGGKD